MSAIVRLEWTRYPDGFEFTEDPYRLLLAHVAPGRYLMPRKPKRSERYVIEGTSERVFIDLANVADDDASVLAFVDKWGLLRQPALQYAAGRSSPAVLARQMRQGVENLQTDPTSEGLEPWQLPRGRWRRAKLVTDSAPRFFFEPIDLFAFCCTELMQLAEAGTEVRKCLRCGELFALGKVGKPPMYCSTACKKAMHRKRKREAEQRASNMVSLRRSAGR